MIDKLRVILFLFLFVLTRYYTATLLTTTYVLLVLLAVAATTTTTTISTPRSGWGTRARARVYCGFQLQREYVEKEINFFGNTSGVGIYHNRKYM